jgi:protein phosphatase 1 regulatory subunit 21
VRSQATVLKKAVLDEQARNNELKDVVKKHEQKIRKHDQEMESVTFRNEQLTKRISVLQQELQVNSHVKKGKNKSTENILQSDTSVLDEELQKKILENAQLVSSVSIIFILKKYSF